MIKISDILEYLKDLWDEYKGARQEIQIEEKWKRNEQLWLGRYTRPEDERSSIKSRVFINLTKQAVDTAVAAIYKTIFTGDWFGVKPQVSRSGSLNLVNPDELKTKARAIKEMLDYEIKMDKTKRKIREFIKSLVVFGTGIMKVVPKSSTYKEFISIVQPLSLNEISQMELVLEKKRVLPESKNIPIWDFYTDLSNKDIQHNRGIFITYETTMDELLRFQDEGIYQDVDVLITQNLAMGSDVLEDKPKEQATGKELYSVDNKWAVRIWEFWGKIYSDDGRAEERKIVIAGKDDMQVVLQDIVNPFWTKERPFLVCNYEDMLEGFYGLGIPDAVEGIQSSINAIIRARLDNLRLVNNVQFGIDITKLDDRDDMEVYPGKVWLFQGNPTEAMRQYTTALMNTDFQDIMLLERFLQEASGIPKLYAGQLSPRRQTATEASLQIQQASMILNDVVEKIEQDILQPLLEWFYKITAQFVDEMDFELVTGERKTLTKAEIVGNYDFWVRGRDLAIQREAKQQLLINFAQFALNAPVIDQKKLLEKIYEGFNIGDPSEIFIEDTPQVAMLKKILSQYPQLAKPILEYLGGVLNEARGNTQGQEGQSGEGEINMQNAGMGVSQELPTGFNEGNQEPNG